jgi:hypothetical protein
MCHPATTKQIEECRGIKPLALVERPMPPSDVLVLDGEGLRIEERVTVGSEESIRKACGLYRIPKKTLALLPKVQCDPDNPDDVLYILKSPTMTGIKDAILYRDVSVKKRTFHMSACDTLHAAQVDQCYNNVDSSGTLKGKVEDVLAATHSLKTLTEFRSCVLLSGDGVLDPEASDLAEEFHSHWADTEAPLQCQET